MTRIFLDSASSKDILDCKFLKEFNIFKFENLNSSATFFIAIITDLMNRETSRESTDNMFCFYLYFYLYARYFHLGLNGSHAFMTNKVETMLEYHQMG